MNRILLLTCGLIVVTVGAESRGWESPTNIAGRKFEFPISLKIIDPESKKSLPPYIVMFAEGKDEKGTDVTGPLSRFEALRGPSKLFPESNDDPGLPVVLRGLRLHRKLKTDGTFEGYMLELQGEHNMIQGPVKSTDVERFLSGKPVQFVMKGELNIGIYSYTSLIKLDTQFLGEELRILKVDGSFTFREGFRRYTSATTRLKPPDGRTFVFRGEVGELPELPEL